MKHVALTTVLLLTTLHACAAHAGPRDSYRPYAHRYPQIIQAHDYPTIEAIEALFRSLKMLGNGDISCEPGTTGIILKQRNDARLVALTVPEKGPVSIAERTYPARETLVLFTTLKRILTGLSKTSMCSGVRFDQFATRAYAKRTIVEFDCGATTVVLESLSNGPSDAERLYVLDVVDRRESFFWGR